MTRRRSMRKGAKRLFGIWLSVVGIVGLGMATARYFGLASEPIRSFGSFWVPLALLWIGLSLLRSGSSDEGAGHFEKRG